MLKKAIFIFLLLISIVCYIVLQKSGKEIFESNRTFEDLYDREIVEVIFNSNEEIKEGQESIKVEVVNTPASTTQGLSGRDEIGVDGMLFIFPTSENRYFWMKNMKFDLDIVWLNDKKVLSISRNVPKPEENTPDNRLETYSPDENVDMVLEIYSNDSEKYKINPGDVVQLVQ